MPAATWCSRCSDRERRAVLPAQPTARRRAAIGRGVRSGGRRARSEPPCARRCPRRPGLTEPPLVAFPAESYWRGEAHRLCDRPGALARVLEEVAAAGVRQAIVVTAASPPGGPHALTTRRADAARARGRLPGRRRRRPGPRRAPGGATLVRSPLRDPPGAQSGRAARPRGRVRRAVGSAAGLGELLDRGYEDAHRQFVEPVVAASGEALAGARAPSTGAS